MISMAECLWCRRMIKFDDLPDHTKAELENKFSIKCPRCGADRGVFRSWTDHLPKFMGVMNT